MKAERHTPHPIPPDADRRPPPFGRADPVPGNIGARRAFQCPGCWSVTMGVEPEGGWLECDCGEKLTCIDLRET